VESLQAVEPNPPWNKDVLSLRYNTYQATSHPLFPKAEKDLNDFLKYAPDERILPD
jgi:hypothetical protein